MFNQQIESFPSGFERIIMQFCLSEPFPAGGTKNMFRLSTPGRYSSKNRIDLNASITQWFLKAQASSILFMFRVQVLACSPRLRA